ncbi:hypothetical protein CEP51_015917 [Fusarium floridanum]|uniref:Uncharacterized protein n=1 Tax=Fusarium floridanum TaxID=1325733 RepID=A0A428P0J1_9HYPO|nr:hypothetical protein CEP51_015917 [Fusarium floridanum]
MERLAGLFGSGDEPLQFDDVVEIKRVALIRFHNRLIRRSTTRRDRLEYLDKQEDVLEKLANNLSNKEDLGAGEDVGPMIPGYPEGTCRSNCPSDRVRVAIDWAFHVCSSYEVGGQATCCKTEYGEEKWEANEKLEVYKNSMADWMVDEYCPNPSKVLKKRGLSSSSTELAVRADKSGDMTPLELLTNILGLVGSQLMLSQYRLIWNNAVRDRHFYLQVTYMTSYIRNNWRLDWEGPSAFARKVLCFPNYVAAQIEAFLNAEIRNRGPCEDAAVVLRKYSDSRNFKVHLEHVVDKNIFEAFIAGSVVGLLPSDEDETSTFGPIPIEFWFEMENLDLSLQPNAPRLPGGRQLARLFERAYECLGSISNDQVFMIADEDINQAKNHMLRFQLRPAVDSITEYLERGDKSHADWKSDCRVIIKRVRASFSVLVYMNLPKTLVRLKKIVKDVYVQFKFAEDVWNGRHPGNRVQLANYWLDWIKKYYARVVSKFKANIAKAMAQIDKVMADDDMPDGYAVQWLELMAQFEEMAENAGLMRIDTSVTPRPNLRTSSSAAKCYIPSPYIVLKISFRPVEVKTVLRPVIIPHQTIGSTGIIDGTSQLMRVI